MAKVVAVLALVLLLVSLLAVSAEQHGEDSNFCQRRQLVYEQTRRQRCLKGGVFDWLPWKICHMATIWGGNRYRALNVESCCQGWAGPNCDIPVPTETVTSQFLATIDANMAPRTGP